MSQDKPNPGPLLASYQNVVKEIKTAAIGLTDGRIKPEEFDSFLTFTIEGFGQDPDGFEIITTILNQEAEAQHAIADRHLQLALLVGAASTGFEDKIKNVLLNIDGEKSIKGETWQYSLQEETPDIIIDEKKLSDPYKKAIQVPNLEIIKKLVGLDAGMTGVEVKKKYSIVKKILKKVGNDAHA